MVYSLFYRRPLSVASSNSKRSSSVQSGKPGSVDEGSVGGVPEELSFDRITSGATCQPCGVRDFMNYLTYVEHNAENLQFFLWSRDYAKRFANLPATEKALAPLWADDKSEADVVKHGLRCPDGVPVGPPNPFNDPSPSPDAPGRCAAKEPAWDASAPAADGPQKMDYHRIAAEAYAAAGVTFQPFTIQPYREEITRIVAVYIAQGSPRELNLAFKERAALLRALAGTTHPSAFEQVTHTAETTLRYQAHPNFIRWTIFNGTAQRIVFARILGGITILAGLAVALMLTLSSAGRGYRAMAAVPIAVGVMILILGMRGICVCLAMVHHRHVRPWELFEGNDAECAYGLDGVPLDGAGGKNSYEDEPWIAAQRKQGVLRRIFLREVAIRDPALRRVHDTMLLQAALAALATGACAVAIFLVAPTGSSL